MRAILVALLVTAALVAGCGADIGGGAETGGGAGTGGGAETGGPAGLVLKVEALPGGSHPYRLPPYIALALYEDGRVLVPGPQIAIYPGPILPQLQEGRLSSETHESFLDEVRAVGVLEPRSDPVDPPAAGAGGLVVTSFLDGERTVVELDPEDPQLAELQELLARLPATGERAYEPEALAVFAAPIKELQPSPDDGLRPRPVTLDWPAGALSKGCQILSGGELQALLPAAVRAHELTFWRSGGALFTVSFRPLVPGESTCADVGF
jgi:hypothetical protein